MLLASAIDFPFEPLPERVQNPSTNVFGGAVDRSYRVNVQHASAKPEQGRAVRRVKAPSDELLRAVVLKKDEVLVEPAVVDVWFDLLHLSGPDRTIPFELQMTAPKDGTLVLDGTALTEVAARKKLKVHLAPGKHQVSFTDKAGAPVGTPLEREFEPSGKLTWTAGAKSP